MFDNQTIEMMRVVVDADRRNRIMSQPMTPVMGATVNGFNCANCGTRKVNFTPIRRGNNPPFFCCFFCALDFEGKNGNEVSAERAAKIKAVFSK